MKKAKRSHSPEVGKEKEQKKMKLGMEDTLGFWKKDGRGFSEWNRDKKSLEAD